MNESSTTNKNFSIGNNKTKRSSLKTSSEMNKINEIKNKCIQFNADLIGVEEVDSALVYPEKIIIDKPNEDFINKRRESLKDEFKYVQEQLKTQPTDEEDDDLTEDSIEVKLNTELNKHIFDDE